MTFRVDSEIFNKFPGLNIGVVVAKGINNTGSDDLIRKLLRDEEVSARNHLAISDLSTDPKIVIWQEAYRLFGTKPKEHRSSVENLYRVVLSGNSLRQINKLVDIYNLISLKHRLPVGGEDLDQIRGDIELTFAKGAEPPTLLLGDQEPRPPHPGEVIYKDKTSAICRRWNWREADRTKLTERTKNCVLVIEGLQPVTQQDIEIATKELTSLIGKFCGGSIAWFVINQLKPEVEI